MSEYHNPVLLKESVDALVQNPDGIYADATFGGGGHSREILGRLSSGGRLIAFDRDEDAIRNMTIEDRRLKVIHNNFRFIHNYAILEQYLSQAEDAAGGYDGMIFDGIIADLGVSSHQFDTPERGFSFRYDAPLDMRMSREAKLTAADIVNSYTEEDLARILFMWGEVEKSRKIASLICKSRQASPIGTTGELCRAIEPAIPAAASHKALARIYQALRIEVNQ